MPLTPWTLPDLIDSSCGVPPACFTAFHGSVNSISSTPSVDRKAIFFPCSSFAMISTPRVLLLVSCSDSDNSRGHLEALSTIRAHRSCSRPRGTALAGAPKPDTHLHRCECPLRLLVNV